MGNYLLELTPSQRSLQARMAASAKHAKTDGREATAAARVASPGSDDYWISKVDPNGDLSAKEREKRARNAKREHSGKSPIIERYNCGIDLVETSGFLTCWTVLMINVHIARLVESDIHHDEALSKAIMKARRSHTGCAEKLS